MYALIDCDNFFVSCERVFNSALENKAVVVLSNNDCCIIARSNEAKALGIKMGENYFKVEKFIEENNVEVLSCNFVLYADMSNRVKGLISKFFPEVEDYSIDESFVNLSNFEKSIDLTEYCKKVEKTIKQGTGIPVSIGIAETKTLAKIAGRFAKKYKAYKKVCIIDTEEKRIKALSLTKIEDVWGIGRRKVKLLKQKNIKTALDFSLMNKDSIRKEMTITGADTLDELNGKKRIILEDDDQKKQSIVVSRSFGNMVSKIEELEEAISLYASMVAGKLRNQKSCATAIIVFIQTNYFREDLKQYQNYITINLPVASNSTLEITQESLKGLKRIFLPNYQYKRAGVMAVNIIDENCVQGSIFDDREREKEKKIMKTMDTINHKYGKNTIKLAVQGTGDKIKIKQLKLSPRYTTRISDFPKTKD